MNRRRLLKSAAIAGASSALPLPLLAQQQRAICYNCPPEWADWGGMLKLINQTLNISVPPDNKNSGPVAGRADRREGQPGRRRDLSRRPSRSAGTRSRRARRHTSRSAGTIFPPA